jgi:hypothetical protein
VGAAADDDARAEVFEDAFEFSVVGEQVEAGVGVVGAAVEVADASEPGHDASAGGEAAQEFHLVVGEHLAGPDERFFGDAAAFATFGEAERDAGVAGAHAAHPALPLDDVDDGAGAGAVPTRSPRMTTVSTCSSVRKRCTACRAWTFPWMSLRKASRKVLLA